MKDKLILDPCCGSKMFWFDKENESVIFADQRIETHILCDGRVLNIEPDTIHDFRSMPFDDNSFYHVVFDPPHLVKLGQSSWMAKKYGKLSTDWQEDIGKGIEECRRVLKPYGTFIFKWNENQIKVSEILKLTDWKPMYGQMRTGKNNGTVWIAFMKII